MLDYVAVGRQAAQAGAALLLDWQGRFKVREKGPQDLVTEADHASQRAIREVLLCAFPRHGFLGEEPGDNIAAEDGRRRWIVDPLDGTVNYVHGVPQFAVSIALEEDGRIIAGVVLDPCANECFTAAAGAGAFLNDEPIAVSDVTQLSGAMTVASFPAGVQRGDPEIERFVNVLVQSQSLRRTGSAALNLSYLAAGRFDGYWAASTKAWDIAAGMLIVREAGGCITDFEGGPVDLARPVFVAAATKELHHQLRGLLAPQAGRPTPDAKRGYANARKPSGAES